MNKKWVDFIVEHGLFIATGASGLVLAYQSSLQPPVDKSLSIIFGLLVTLGVSEMITKYRHTLKIKEGVDELLKRSGQDNSLILVDTIPFEKELADSECVKIVANTLNRTLSQHGATLRSFLENGGKAKMVVIDPESGSLATVAAAARSASRYDTDYYRNRVKTSIADLQDIDTRQRNGGDLELRLCPFAPSFGIYLFDERQKNARVYIRLFAHFEPLSTNPTFLVRKVDNPLLFDYFSRQFGLIWDASQDAPQMTRSDSIRTSTEGTEVVVEHKAIAPPIEEKKQVILGGSSK